MLALQRAIAHACLDAEAGAELARDPEAFFAAHGVAPEDIEAILAAPLRLAVYRTLIRNGLSSVVLRMLPRTRARMNAACRGRFDADLAAFVEQVGPRTHYLRDVPAELFAWAEPRWRADHGVPEYLPDLAAFELTHFDVAACVSARSSERERADTIRSEATGAQDAATAVALDRPLVWVESTRLVHYRWAVHELADDQNAADEPARRDVCLLAYRDETHAVQWLELTPLAGAVVHRLLSGEALGPAIEHACADHRTAPSDVLSDIARLLADLGRRGVITGARQA
jgi:hypothetical protein